MDSAYRKIDKKIEPIAKWKKGKRKRWLHSLNTPQIKQALTDYKKQKTGLRI